MGNLKGLYPEGLITGIIFSLANRWGYNRGGGGLITGGAYKQQFMVYDVQNKDIIQLIKF